MKELPLIVKADVQGSAEAVKASLEKLSNEEVRVRVIHAGVGAINESDILLASTSGAIIVGFNVRPDAAAQASGHRANVDMRFYRVIYDAVDEIEAAMKGMLAPKYEEVVIGHAEVRMTYKVSAIGTVAGCMVKDGKVTRDSLVRVLRDNIVVHEGEIGSLPGTAEVGKNRPYSGKSRDFRPVPLAPPGPDQRTGRGRGHRRQRGCGLPQHASRSLPVPAGRHCPAH